MRYVNAATTANAPSPQELLGITREFQEKEEFRKRMCAASIAEMEPCEICGMKIGYEMDPERFIVCRHVRDALREKCPDSTQPAVAYPNTLTGIPVEVREAVKVWA
jgi:hypothetical protein